jgi:hypothetical protein
MEQFLRLLSLRVDYSIRWRDRLVNSIAAETTTYDEVVGEIFRNAHWCKNFVSQAETL